jgi:hypothetical protein
MISPAFDIVMACRRKDLGVLRLTIPRLRQFIPHQRCVIFTASQNLRLFSSVLGPTVKLIDEDTVIPSMTLQSLRTRGALPGFPEGAGWYFQQFLKYSYPYLFPDAEKYLIWDADTIPLRPMSVFGAKGESLLTPAYAGAAEPPVGVYLDEQTLQILKKATLPHEEYFRNYEVLLKEPCLNKKSFISQHMPIQTDVLKALLQRIDFNFSGKEHWAWKIIKNLRGSSGNLFSEYEFYAQFALRHAPDRHAVRSLQWSRGGRFEGPTFLRQQQLDEWAVRLDFAAVEAWSSPWRRRMLQIFHLLPGWFRNSVRRAT